MVSTRGTGRMSTKHCSEKRNKKREKASDIKPVKNGQSYIFDGSKLNAELETIHSAAMLSVDPVTTIVQP
jgi:hypothetical protein